MKYVISLSGKKQSGKDTVGKFLQELINTKEKKNYGILNNVKLLSFAEPLKKLTKQFLNTVYNIDVSEEHLNGKFKEIPLFDCFNNPIMVKTLYRNSAAALYNEQVTTGKLLQLIGTEFGRNFINCNIWVETCFNKICMDINTTKWFILTDTRFPNEIAYMQKNLNILNKINPVKFLSVRIIRESLEKKINITENKDTHSSETALDDYNFDVTIHNDSDLDYLKKQIITFFNSILKQ